VHVIKCDKCDHEIRSKQIHAGRSFKVQTSNAIFNLHLSKLGGKENSETHICIECVREEMKKVSSTWPRTND